MTIDKMNKKGFTLLEILVATLIMAIGLVGTAGLLISVIKSDDMSNEMTIATTLAQSQMEEIRRAGYFGTPVAGNSVTENPVSGYPGFTRVTAASATDVTGAKAITVTVTYASFGSRTVELNTILSR